MANFLSESFHEEEFEFFDLQENLLPMCDGDKCYDLPEVINFRKKIDKASGIIMAIPIYNFNVSSGAKNIVELGGKKLYDKNFGFLCAAGGKNSYMSVMGLANSLMIDYRCYIIPKFVFAIKKDFDETKVIDLDIKERIKELGKEMIRITKALSKD
jgi:FMN reductase